MNRRDSVLALLALGAAIRSSSAHAKQMAKIPKIGFLSLGSAVEIVPYLDVFGQGLRELGYVEGQTIAIEYRYADGKTERLPALLAELLALKVNVIETTGTTSVQAAKDATKTTPIVIAAGADPVEMGFAQSLARPGRNITGLSLLAGGFIQKQLELLREAMPRAKVVAALLHGANPGNPRFVKALTTAAPALGVRIHALEVRGAGELEGAFAQMVRAKADALFVIQDPVFSQHAKTIADLALSHRLATMIGDRLYVRAGGLMSYGIVYKDLFRRSATYVDKILKGANPGDLPIEQPTKFEMVVNLKTAKALGLVIPQSVLLRADEVIE